MKKDKICTYEVAKLAKEKGFDWGCLYHYDCKGSLHQHYAYDATNSGVGVDDLLMYDGHLFTSECLAPTQSLLQRWLREEKGVNMQVIWMEPYNRYYWSLWINDEFEVSEYIDPEQAYSNYELALEDALKYALENLV